MCSHIRVVLLKGIYNLYNRPTVYTFPLHQIIYERSIFYKNCPYMYWPLTHASALDSAPPEPKGVASLIKGRAKQSKLTSTQKNNDRLKRAI